MPISDSLLLQRHSPQTSIIFAVSQLQGARETQEDYFVNFSDECFVVCDGVGGMPHGEVAARLAGDTAIWAYRAVKRRTTYWTHKKLFLNRIFRTANITVWQKQREEGFTDGMASTMLVCMTIDRRFYIGNAGDSAAFLMREGRVEKLTTDDVTNQGRLTKAVGTSRYGLKPSIVWGDLFVDDRLILVTDGVASCINQEFCANLEFGNQNQASLSRASARLLEHVAEQGVTDNMTVCLIQRIGSGGG